MKTIFKVKKKCSVPGCSSVDCYSLSKGSFGSISLCRECARQLYSAYKPKAKSKAREEKND